MELGTKSPKRVTSANFNMHGGGIQKTLLAILSAIATATGSMAELTAQDLPLLKVRVSDAVKSAPIAEAFIAIALPENSGGSSKITDELGWATMPELRPAPATNGLEVVTVATLEIHRSGYVPVKREVHFSEHEPSLFGAMQPLSAGYMTPVVRADKGGSFRLEGLGTVAVAAGALSQDARLCVIPLPHECWSYGLVEGVNHQNVLRNHVWLHAIDANGQVATGVLPTAPGMITLLAPPATSHIVPGNATASTWTTHSLGETFIGVPQLAPANELGGQVMMPLAAGHNLLTQSYTTAATECTGTAFPWFTKHKWLSTRREYISTTPVSCGAYTVGGCPKVESTDTRTITHSFSSEVYETCGFKGGTKLAEVTGQCGFKLTGTLSDTSTVQNLVGDSKPFVAGGLAAGPNATNHCYNALSCVGLLFRTYEVRAYQITTCGGPHVNEKVIGTFEVCIGLSQWFEGPDPTHPGPVWNPNCVGCAATGTPPTLPGPL